jgi:hypothetical protein
MIRTFADTHATIADRPGDLSPGMPGLLRRRQFTSRAPTSHRRPESAGATILSATAAATSSTGFNEPVPSVTLRVRCSHVRPHDHTTTEWFQLVRADYDEMPGLHLTKPQAQRLWNLETTMCDAVLDALEAARFLRRTRTGAYVKG